MMLPRNVAAENAYRAAWMAWCLTTDDEEKRKHEIVMDCMQEQIAVGPMDERWQVFIDTLPGYRQFWQNWYDKTMSECKSLTSAQ